MPVTLNRDQALALLEMYGGCPADITLMEVREGHSGPGIYAYFDDYSSEGSAFLERTSQVLNIDGDAPLCGGCDNPLTFPDDLETSRCRECRGTAQSLTDRDLIRLSLRLAGLIADHAEWSQATFGADGIRGPIGALKHLIKEAIEAQDKPRDPLEYADCFLLILDASRRAGFTFNQLLIAAEQKLQINKSRHWPPCVDGEPCEHHKSPELGVIRADGGYPQHVPVVTTPLRGEVQGDNPAPYAVPNLVEGDIG